MKQRMIRSTVLLLIPLSIAWPQTHPDTLRVPVTFYEYHSDGSNPEFQPNLSGYTIGRHLHMVDTMLDGTPGSGKPAIGSIPCLNCSIAKWFRPWAPLDSFIPNYSTPQITDCGNGLVKVNYDTAFKNVVFHDTLLFLLASAGIYSFDDQTFFPLDGKGFGNEGQSHNYSFTMELHWQFTMAPGLTFYFRGDDDVWAFINGKLVMDIGGIHPAIMDSINVDNLGLIDGQKYWMDFFYCERRVTGSSIRITSNIISTQSPSIAMTVLPLVDTIAAGDSVRYTAAIKDHNGAIIHDYDQSIKWSLSPSTTSSYLKGISGTGNDFMAIDAYKQYVVSATLDTVNNVGQSIHLLWKDTVYVKAGPPANLFIEANADSSMSLYDSVPIGSVTIASSVLKDSIYAVLRDKYCNWVSHAMIANWLSRDTTVVNVAAGRTQLGEGILTRQTAKSDTTFIVASQQVNSAMLSDSLRVIAFFALTTKRTFSAVASDNTVKQVGIDNDDYVLLTFDKPVEIFPVTANNIDILFPLSNGHSWLNGFGSIGGAEWNPDSTKLLITLSTQVAPPTIAIGDTIVCSSVQNKTVLTGSFNPPTLADAGLKPERPAEFVSFSQSRHAADGLVFTFSSSAINGIKIRIIDPFGRFIKSFDSRNLSQSGNNRFSRHYADNSFNCRMAIGIYFVQVFRNEKLIKSVPFIKN